MFLWTLTHWKNPPPSGCPGAKHLIQLIGSECRAATFLWLQLTYCWWNDKLRCVSSRKPKCLAWCLSFLERHRNRRIISLNLREDSRQMSRWREINSGSLFVCQCCRRCFYVLCGTNQLKDTTFFFTHRVSCDRRLCHCSVKVESERGDLAGLTWQRVSSLWRSGSVSASCTHATWPWHCVKLWRGRF